MASGAECARHWERCFFCQSSDTRDLRDPSKSTRQSRDEVYGAVSLRIIELYQLGEIHSNTLDLSSIGVGDVENMGGGELANIMSINNAVWHKKCVLKVNPTEVERACKRHISTARQPSPVKTRRLSSAAQEKDPPFQDEPTSHIKFTNIRSCILCGEQGGDTLHKASTFGLDDKVGRCAMICGDKSLIAKLSPGDLIAIDAVYHLPCLTKLYRRARTVEEKKSEADSLSDKVAKAQAFHDLVEYIEYLRDSDTPVVYMSDLCQLYSSRLVSLGLDGYVHSTRLRESLLLAVPDLQEVRRGTGLSVDLAFDSNITTALEMLTEQTCADEMRDLYKAAKILQKHILSTKNSFGGHFTHQSAVQSVPPILMAFMQMTLDGPTIIQGKEPPKGVSSATLSLSQLVTYNTVKRRLGPIDTIPRHIRERETPLAIYIAVKLWSVKRSESLIQTLHELGLCISSARLRTISNDLANSVVAHYESRGLVVPPSALHDVFTICLADNFDHNPSSTTCGTSFHGFSMSLLQFPTEDAAAEPGAAVVMIPEVMGRTSVSHLPDAYTNMAEIVLRKDEAIYVPRLGCDLPPIPAPSELEEIITDEYNWLQHANILLTNNEELSQNDWISWAAYNASINEPPSGPNTPSLMLPLFRENANDSSTMYHSLCLTIKIIRHLNPRQTPILEADQPLYALCKKLQWKFPSSVGEDECLLMLGTMHTEKMVYTLLGDWLSGSGWTTLLDKACVATRGSAQSFLAASHITRTRYAHQVTSLALFYLLQLAFGSYLEQHDDTTPPLTRNEWVEQQCKLQPQFSYWHQTLKLQLTAFAVSVICAITIYPPKFETIHFFILSIHHCG